MIELPGASFTPAIAAGILTLSMVYFLSLVRNGFTFSGLFIGAVAGVLVMATWIHFLSGPSAAEVSALNEQLREAAVSTYGVTPVEQQFAVVPGAETRGELRATVLVRIEGHLHLVNQMLVDGQLLLIDGSGRELPHTTKESTH